MPTMYTINCVILGETTAFTIKIASNETVGFLKDIIKEKRKNKFANMDAVQLNLHQVEISGSKTARMEQLNTMAGDIGQRDGLDEFTEFAKMYSTAPPKDTIHIIVQPPKSDGELELQKPKELKFVNHVDAVRFFTTTVGTYTIADLRDSSNNTNLHKGAQVASTPFLDNLLSDGHQNPSFVSVYLRKLDEKRPACRNVGWDPLLLQGTLADHEHLCRFKAGSDFSLVKVTYGPLILGKIVSEDTQSDRWKMLFEGIAVCRYQNMIRGDREATTLCLYLNKAYEMERYLVYQDADTNLRDVHVLHDLTLDLTKIQNTFLLSKQLFNFRHHLIQIPEILSSRREEAIQTQEEIEKIYRTSVTAEKQLKSKAGRSSQAPTGTLGPISEDAVLQASFKAIHVLNYDQKDVATAIRRSDTQSVVLKRIRTNSSELRILRLLQSRGSSHVIPLLDVVERPPGISTLVMPHYIPILDLEKGRAEDLALQLIGGVDWLHRQLISHSDIKERNLVFDERLNCLFIIDFGLAVEHTNREQKVRGARGTPEHVASEVGITSSWENHLEEEFLDEESIYSPILADVWAVGDVINHFHKRFRSSTESIRMVVKKVAKELQVVDPIKPLLLQEAERRIAAECSMTATAPDPPAASHWIDGIHHTVSNVALQA